MRADEVKISGRIWVIGVIAPAVVTGITYETLRRRILFEKILGLTDM